MTERFASDARPKEYSAERAEVTQIRELLLEKIPEALQKFAWPLELQGKGEARESDGTFIVKYPSGDRLLSYVTLIHELGHPLQHERNQALHKGTQTHANLVAEEEDAWERGWARFKQANPDLVERLETEVSDRHAGGSMSPKSFRELYDWIRENVLKRFLA